MDLEKSQVFANVSSALGNLVVAGIVNREFAKTLIKPFLPENAKVKRDNTVGKVGGTVAKPAVTTATDVK